MTDDRATRPAAPVPPPRPAPWPAGERFLRELTIVNVCIPAALLACEVGFDTLGADPVAATIDLTGRIALTLLMVTLTVSPLVWVTGWSGWLAARRPLGLAAFFYALLHAATYVTYDRGLDLVSTGRELVTRWYLLLGVGAVVLMVPLAVTSVGALQRAMGSKWWKRLHRLVYLVAAMGVAHYYLLVKADVRAPLIYAGVLAALLAVRLGHAAWRRIARPASPSDALDRAAAPAADGRPVVTFAKSLRTAPASPGQTVLEVGESLGLKLPYHCRTGVCGRCKVHLARGQVAMDVTDALSNAARARGTILACQARPETDVTVDA